MRFVIIVNDQQEEIWINTTEIAAIKPSRTDTYNSQILLKNGESFRCLDTAEEFVEKLKWHFEDNIPYNR